MSKTIFLMLASLLVACSSTAPKKTSGPQFDQELSSFQYPFEVKSFALSSQNQNLQMRYMDVGPRDATKHAVLLHGKNFSGFYWEKIANELQGQGYRVIIPDQIGFGKSSKPEHYQYSFMQLALNTKKLLEELKIKQATVIGHSMGGMLATHMTRLYPELVSKLILINPIGLEAYLDYVQVKDPEFFYQSEVKKTPEDIRQYQKKNYYDGQWNDEYEALIVPHIGWINGPDWERVAWNNALTYSPIFNEDITRHFNEVKAPVHLIIGTRDRTGPGRGWMRDGVSYELGQYQRLGKNAKQAFPQASLYELEGLGHLPQFENYERFKEVFLKTID